MTSVTYAALDQTELCTGGELSLQLYPEGLLVL